MLYQRRDEDTEIILLLTHEQIKQMIGELWILNDLLTTW
jgi:hypothetical protein